MEQYAFGFWQAPLSLENSLFQVRPIDKFEAIVRSVLDEPTAGKRWFYPPISMSATEGIYLPSPRYELPVTHLLTTQNRYA